jgi:hypothetical protein
MTALPGDAFPVIIDRPSRSVSSVLRGCYVTPHAQALLTRNATLIDDILLDTTFKIIGIALALAFGPTEDSALYETFSKPFQRLGGQNLVNTASCPIGAAHCVPCAFGIAIDNLFAFVIYRSR